MPKITAETGLVTQINVFDVHPGRQEQLIDHLAEAARSCRDHIPGWISASLHLSLIRRCKGAPSSGTERLKPPRVAHSSQLYVAHRCMF